LIIWEAKLSESYYANSVGHKLPLQPSVSFLDLHSGEIRPNIWHELLDEQKWKDISFDLFEVNNIAGHSNRNLWYSLIGGIQPIYTGQIVNAERNKVLDPIYYPNRINNVKLDHFLESSFAFFNQFKNATIGVQLSGGLDSSLIIGLLRYFNIEHALIGLSSKRFEFRTERYIQNLLAEKSTLVHLIDEADVLPCSNMLEVPPHQLPDLLSLNYAQDNAMATACKDLNVEVLLSGGGGDTLLVHHKA